ncbi:MAG TPA: serine--tRNA ligase [Chloroflexia bacterium]|nr:serine--tRNA ligase [Chloroflexia bacterium]
MLDIKLFREQPDLVRTGLSNRGVEDAAAIVSEVLRLDERRRSILVEKEGLQARRNELSKQVPKAAPNERAALIEESKGIGPRISELDKETNDVDTELRDLLLSTPNLPHPSAPIGPDEDDNVTVRTWGEPKKFDFEPLAHWDIGVRLGLVDFERGVKIGGARAYILTGLGARLERALLNFMLDMHVYEQNYTEVFPPFLVTEDSMIGTGQLPKFKEDMYALADDPLYLIPTAEVPVTNMHREEILTADQLPLRYTAYTASFRREAGSAGKDVRGVIRVHQFNKVEMVKFTTPETSYEELETLTNDAEAVLQRLNLPYRVSEHCTGDLGFCASKSYDLDVWIPAQDTYREISSCSNFEDYQARRANIRYRPGPEEKPRFVHTLNGSGLAVGRTWAAVLENFQQEDGSVIIPGALRPYMGGIETIKAQQNQE